MDLPQERSLSFSPGSPAVYVDSKAQNAEELRRVFLSATNRGFEATSRQSFINGLVPLFFVLLVVAEK